MGKTEIKEEFNYNNQILEIKFSEKIKFSISNFLSDVFGQITENSIKQVILNLSNTNFITLPGSIFILCFVSYLKRVKNSNLDTRIIIDSERIVSYLVNLGFFYTNEHLWQSICSTRIISHGT